MPRIAVDAMGGDHAPEQVVLGAIDAANSGFEPILVGDMAAIKSVLNGADLPIVAASEVIEMNDDPARAIREKKDASVSVAARLVSDREADGLVSAGSTGAALAAAAFIIGRIDGVSRPAIASVFPHGEIVLDSGRICPVAPNISSSSQSWAPRWPRCAMAGRLLASASSISAERPERVATSRRTRMRTCHAGRHRLRRQHRGQRHRFWRRRCSCY